MSRKWLEIWVGLRGKARGRNIIWSPLDRGETEIDILGKREMSGVEQRKTVYIVSVGPFLGKNYSKWHSLSGFHQETRDSTPTGKAGKGKVRRISAGFQETWKLQESEKPSPKSSRLLATPTW